MQRVVRVRPFIALAVPGEIASEEAAAIGERLLQPDEHDRVRRLKSKDDQHAGLIAQSLLRLGLSANFDVPPQDWRFRREANKKPVIASPPGLPMFDFSLSRTAGMIALLVADSVCGVDIENWQNESDLKGVASASLTPEELASIAQLSDAAWTRNFLKLWTLKEAYAKATGRGLAMPFKQVSFKVDASNQVAATFSAAVNDSAENWWFTLVDAGASHVVAAAIMDADRFNGGTIAITRTRVAHSRGKARLEFYAQGARENVILDYFAPSFGVLV